MHATQAGAAGTPAIPVIDGAPGEPARPLDPIADLWDAHFRAPKAAYARAQGLIDADPAEAGERALAWAELTVAYHHLFFTGSPSEAGPWLPRALERFDRLGDRRGVLLARTGAARLLLIEQKTLAAREMLLGLHAEAMEVLPPQDRFWVINALGASHYYSDEIDEAIRYLHLSLETLRTLEVSPHLPTAMSNLAAALVTVADYAPARELAQDALAMLPHYDNPQLWLFVRSNLAEAQMGSGDVASALATIEAMIPDPANPPRSAAQGHYLAIAAEVFAQVGRFDEAAQCVLHVSAIHERYPGGFNEVYRDWAGAALAAARDPGDAPLPALERAIASAERLSHIPTLCKAHAVAAARLAQLGRWAEAYSHEKRLGEVNSKRLSHRASVKYYLLKVENELSRERAERDRAERQRMESDALNRQLARLNDELQRKVREVEELQARLATEAVHDPLTQLFNRRYLDSVLPGLLSSAARRGAPLSLALVDLDHFKRVNDLHGHPAGDRVLMRIGRLLATSLRPSDVLCRYGGEEFCVVLPDTDAKGAQVALTSLATSLRSLQVEWAGAALSGFTFSAGIAVAPGDGNTLSALVEVADVALYAAKAAGRDRIIVGGPAARRHVS